MRNKTCLKLHKQCSFVKNQEKDDLQCNNNFSDSIILNSMLFNRSMYSQRNSSFKDQNPQIPKILITKVNASRLSTKLCLKSTNTKIKKNLKHDLFQLINSNLLSQNQAKTIDNPKKKITRNSYQKKFQSLHKISKNNSGNLNGQRCFQDFSTQSRRQKTNPNSKQEISPKISIPQPSKQLKRYKPGLQNLNQICRVTPILLSSRPKSTSKKIITDFQLKNSQIKKMKQLKKRKYSDQSDKLYVDLRIQKRYSDTQQKNSFELKPWELDLPLQTNL